MKKTILILLCILSLISVAYAHPGQTDDNGGHYDHSTGEYHYHHGYSAHDHYDMDGDGDIDCPFDFDDQTGKNSGGDSDSSGSSYYSSDNYSYNTPGASSSANKNSGSSGRTDASQTTQKEEGKEAPARVGFGMDMFECLLLLIISLAFVWPLIFAAYVFIYAILKAIFSWILKITSLEGDELDKVAGFCSSFSIVVVLLVLFLFPLVDFLQKDPGWLAAGILILVFVLYGLVLYLISVINKQDDYRNEINSRKNEIKELNNEISSLARKNNELTCQNQSLRNYVSDAEEALDCSSAQAEAHKSQFLAETKKYNQKISLVMNVINTHLDEDRSDFVNKLLEEIDCDEIVIPDDVYFRDGIPIIGTVTEDKPYGDLTLYISRKGTHFHTDRFCGSGFYKSAYAFNVIGEYTPCKRCAASYPNVIPEWYLKIYPPK